MLETVAQVVEALGRHYRTDPEQSPRVAVAERYEVTYKAVGNWCSWNAFPERLHFKIAKDCEQAQLAIPADLFERKPTPRPAAIGAPVRRKVAAR
jgi:hypothetical protein